MAAKRARKPKKKASPPRVLAQIRRIERELPARDWIVSGTVFPHIDGRDRYQMTVHHQVSEAATAVVCDLMASRGIAFCPHVTKPSPVIGGFGRPRNAMGPV